MMTVNGGIRSRPTSGRGECVDARFQAAFGKVEAADVAEAAGGGRVEE